LRERICILDRFGAIVLTNQGWNQFARENGASPARCGTGVNYLRVCQTATGPFSERALEAAMGIESVLRGASSQFTLDYPCPSASRKAWFRLTARPLHRPNTGAVVSHSDITSHAVLAEQLRATRAHYGALLENPADVVTILTAAGVVRYQSPASADVLGLRSEDLAGHPLFEFVHPDDLEALRKLLRACLQWPQRKHFCEYRFRNRDGSWRLLQGVARKLLSSREGGIILNSRDITHQKLAEQSLLAKQDALARDRQDLEALAAWLLREREEERRRVASELNGNLHQRLASMSLQAAHLPCGQAGAGQIQALQACVASLGRDLRQISGGLYPAMLDHFGLAVALREYCAEFTRREGIAVGYVHRGISTRLPWRSACALYRIAEEALAHAARHACAKRAWVTLSRTAKGIKLAIRDDGAGLDPAAVDAGSDLGILAMRERLRAVNGSLSIRVRPGAGTEVVALAPLFAPGDQPCAAVAGHVVVNPLGQH
jgi:PAS domain S-box-containing protein